VKWRGPCGRMRIVYAKRSPWRGYELTCHGVCSVVVVKYPEDFEAEARKFLCRDCKHKLREEA